MRLVVVSVSTLASLMSLASASAGCGRRGFDARDGTDTEDADVIECLQLPTTDAQFCGPLVLSTGNQEPYGLTLTQTDVIWLDAGNGRLLKCAKTGCNNQPTLLANAKNRGFFVAVDDTHVYWNHNQAGELARCPLGGCPNLVPEILASVATATRVVLDDTHIYTSTNNGRLVRVLKTGGTPLDVATGIFDPAGLWLHGSDMLMAVRGEDRIVRVPLVGGPAIELVPNQASTQVITANATHMFFASATQIVRADFDGQDVLPLALAGASEGIALDDTYVYFGDASDKSARKVPLSGGTAITLGSNIDTPATLSVDDKYIYVPGRIDGNIYRFPK